jgi:hypothetical protein
LGGRGEVPEDALVVDEEENEDDVKKNDENDSEDSLEKGEGEERLYDFSLDFSGRVEDLRLV